ncbi:MAG: protein translocase subunit SecF [Deltaproteobacteria bacterium]|nr:protein translocase subunit SecF [Deltaproteobacteria bacterium]
MELIGKTNIDFTGKRNYAFAFSGVLCLLGIVAIVMIGLGKANMGVDFAGGTSVQLKFEGPVVIDQARKTLESNGLQADLQQFAEGNKLLIRVKKSDIPLGKVADRVVEVFTKEFSANKFVVESSTEIGPTVGKSLQQDALVAVIISMLAIVIYIAWRFEFKFGVAATIATFHDVLAVLGVLFILNTEITLLIITALLTIAGYSLTDTVVIFDRIRENLRSKAKGALEATINRSVNEVLSRSIITVLTMFIASASIFFFGGEVLHDFSLALLIGLVVGSYSSIYVASPILIVWKTKGGKLIK